MNSKTLFCKELYKNQLKIFGAVSIIYTVIVFFAFPLVLILQEGETPSILYYNQILIGLSATIPIFLGLTFNFLYSTKSINQLHSLPFTRTQIYFSYLLAGITMLIIPYLFNGCLMVLLRAINPELIEITINQLIVSSLHFMFINIVLFSVSVFVAILSCSGFIHIGLTYALLGVPALTIMAFFDMLLRNILYGYSNSFNWEDLFIKISPLFLFMTYDHYDEVVSPHYYIIGVVQFILVVGLGLFFYKRRKMESVNDWVAFKWVHVAIKYLAAIIGSILLAAFFISINGNAEVSILWLLVGGFIGYVIASMFLYKKMNILNQWKGIVGYSLVITVLYIGIIFDVTGYLARVPDVTDVDHVLVDARVLSDLDGTGRNVAINDSDDIQRVLSIHEEMIKFYKEDNQEIDRYGSWLEINYHMKNGSTMSRYYYYPEEKGMDLAKQFYSIAEMRELNLKEHLDVINTIEVSSSKGNFSLTDPDKIREIVNLMEKDYAGMSYEERLSNKDIADLYINTEDKYGREDLGYYKYIEIGRNCINTLAWLKDEGLYDLVILEATDFAEVNLLESKSKEKDYYEETITDPEQIAYYFDNCIDYASYYNSDDYVNVRFYSPQGFRFNGLISKELLLK